MAAVDTVTSSEPYLLRGTIQHPPIKKKPLTYEVLLENPLQGPFNSFQLKVSCYLDKFSKKGLFSKTEDLSRVPITFLDTKSNKEKTAYLQKKETEFNPPLLAELKLSNPDPNKELTLPPTEHYFNRKVKNSKTVGGIPSEEIDRLLPILNTLRTALPSSNRVHIYDLTFKYRKMQLCIDSRPDGLDPFIILKTIGDGTSKVVYEGIDLRSKKIVAYSFTDLRDEYSEEGVLVHDRYVPAVLEQDVIRKISQVGRHPNFIRYYQIGSLYVRSPNSKIDVPTMIAMMNIQDQGDLFNNLMNKKVVFTPKEFVKILIDAFKGIAFLHAQGLVHKDIKLENLFLHRSKKGVLKLKIGDFGFTGLEGKICGSASYIGPEIVYEISGFREIANAKKERPLISYDPQKLYTPASDVYALSVVLYGLSTRMFPLLSQSMNWMTKSNLKTDKYLDTLQYIVNYTKNNPQQLSVEIPDPYACTISQELKLMPTPVRLKFSAMKIAPPLQLSLKAPKLNDIYISASKAEPAERMSAIEIAKCLHDYRKNIYSEITTLRAQIVEIKNTYFKSMHLY
ncbi:MAG: protein kinase [Parachlamydiales bacterium]|jgi:serine/threonine protein kinase